MTVYERAQRYVSMMPAAVSGQSGHGQTLEAACVLVHGFGLSESEAAGILNEYNARCVPPWSERELKHKLEEAGRITTHQKPRGHLKRSVTWEFGGGEGPKPTAPMPPSERKLPCKAVPKGGYDLARAVVWPKAVGDAARQLILAAFKDGDGIGIAQEVIAEDGGGRPKDQGITLSRKQWLDKLSAVGGDPNRIFATAERSGAFIRINPLKAGGASDADVTSFRHALLEFDHLALEQQWNLIEQSNVPCTAILHSGKRSLHAWVKVDAGDRREYDERVRLLYDHFKEYNLDQKNKNPSRLSRLPGMVRGTKRQELLALNVGAESWGDWAQSEGEGLPKIEDGAAMLSAVARHEIVAPDEIVGGLLHRGHKLVLGGGSKTNKTWSLLDLATSVACGIDWLGFQCTRGRVLYLNFEIDKAHFAIRLSHVEAGRQCKIEAGQFEIWNLRGYTAPYFEMIPAVLKHTKEREYHLIVLDPLYKLLGNADENKATDITQLVNHIESLALQTKAAIAYAAHFSKGNQAGKESIDRISGSGVFARDADTLMTLTPHEEDAAYVAEFTLRNFKRVEPFCVRWNFPLMGRDDGLDARKIKKPNATAKYDLKQILSALKDEPNGLSVLAWSNKAVVPRGTLQGQTYIGTMRTRGFIKTIGEGNKAKQAITDVGLAYLLAADEVPRV